MYKDYLWKWETRIYISGGQHTNISLKEWNENRFRWIESWIIVAGFSPKGKEFSD